MQKPVTNITPTKQQKERRERSEKICAEHDVPVYQNKDSLYVDSDEHVTLRSVNKIAERTLALCFLGLKSEGLEQQHLNGFAEKYDLHYAFTPEELKYVCSSNPEQQQHVNANWRYESMHVLLWALGYIDQLVYPDQMCNVGDDVAFIFDKTKEEFIDNAMPRSKKEILDEADLILRLNWACVNARIKNEPAPGNLDGSVVYERHYALNWLTGYMNQEWDSVSTDT